MKFDIDQNLFNAVIGLMAEAPVPHKVSNPVIQALISQANDPKIQSLQYPDNSPRVADEVTEILKPPKPQKRRGRPPKVKTNGAEHAAA